MNKGSSRFLLDKYDLKEELRRCHACNDWMYNVSMRLKRDNNYYYFHPFCYSCIVGKNPNYKSLNNTSILFSSSY